MTARKPVRSGAAEPGLAPEATAGIPNTAGDPVGDQPVFEPLTPEPLTPEAWQRLRDRLVRKYH
ncbi:hypothetical protein [Streptomyces hyaluromycini]|uniref:hypothetical protein n=1 Tax=Streptomyces hyaluromycini TaxID=1377993 RepID=UPI000B5C919E|nr:hypothetical protein [Streptomyces hyaluromycini]